MKALVKALVLTPLVLLSILAEAAADEQAVYDFRKVSWGATRAEVIASEGRAVARDEPNQISFAMDSKLADCCEAWVYYVFDNDALVRSGYIITEHHVEANLYLRDFTLLSEALTSKYGKAENNDVLYSQHYGDLGMAILTGKLVKQEIWTTERTEIMHDIHGDNFKASHVIQYKSRSHMGKEEQKSRQSGQL